MSGFPIVDCLPFLGHEKWEAVQNVLYIYLASRGYDLSVGRIGKLECDFIARRRNAYAYIQVSMSIADPEVEEREYRPFGYIREDTRDSSSRSTRCCRGERACTI